MKTKPLKNIMVALRDCNRSSQALLRKAAALAERFDAHLQVLHVSAVPYEAFDLPELSSKPITPQQMDVMQLQRQRLDKFVVSTLGDAAAINCLSTLDYPPADGIVRQVLKHKPDMLVVQSHQHSRTARVFLSNTDWELIRNCPCPLWIVKANEPLKANLSVLAAVDPFHSHAKPAKLDAEILDIAGRLVGTGAGKLGLCHAYHVPTNVVSVMGEVTLVPATPAETRRYKAQVTTATKRLSKQYAIAGKDQLLSEGDPAIVLPQQIKRWKADVLVMGAVSRRGLKRLFIGNTAERVLDAVTCDVVVIKPRSFKCPVPRKAGVFSAPGVYPPW